MRKLINLFTKFDKFNLTLNNLVNNLDFYLNKKTIYFLKDKKLKKKLKQINIRFPSKLNFYIYIKI